MNFSDLAENVEHIFLKTEFDLKIIMLLLEHKKKKKKLLISSNTNCLCFNVYSSCFIISIRLSELEDNPKKDNSATGDYFRMFKWLKMS